MELYHHGILGQKWGVRRFQNKDGSRTSAASTFAAGAVILGGMKYSYVKQNKLRNEQRFKSFGERVLPQKVDRIVWQSDDLSQYITKE